MTLDEKIELLAILADLNGVRLQNDVFFHNEKLINVESKIKSLLKVG